MDMVRAFMVRFAWIVFAILLIVLAVECNVGKGLACIIAPGALEVHDGDTNTQAQQDNFSINQSAAADTTQSIRQFQQSSNATF